KAVFSNTFHTVPHCTWRKVKKKKNDAKSKAGAFFTYRYLSVVPEKALALALWHHLCYLAPLVGAGYLLVLVKNIKTIRDGTTDRASV
ncbi:MAG: hypothetical protein HQK55_16890, partial [Deltaproteobacteria bacterium]|nr:hypothetical protein [Deltaproteobacteria bacterium]